MPHNLFSRFDPQINDWPSPVPDSASDTLMAEANHRITNNLSTVAALLRLQAAEVRRARETLSPDEAAALIYEAASRVDVVGQLHRLLAEGGSGTVELSDYLRRIGEAMVDAMADRDKMDLSVHCQAPVTLEADQALRIGLIVGELVTNAIKYAHPAQYVAGSVKLSCAMSANGALEIAVADDGVGLPEDFDPQHQGGLGLRTIRSLTTRLGATLSFESCGLGLTVTLTVPTAIH